MMEGRGEMEREGFRCLIAGVGSEKLLSRLSLPCQISCGVVFRHAEYL